MNNKQSLSFLWRMGFANDPSLQSTTKLVLHTLHIFMKNDEATCYPSYETIAAMSSLDIRSISAHLKKAEKAGWIKRRKIGKSAGQGWARNNYFGTFPDKKDKELNSLPSIKGRELDVEEMENNDQKVMNVIPINSFHNSLLNSDRNEISEGRKMFEKLKPRLGKGGLVKE